MAALTKNQDFHPTPAMRLYAFYRAKAGVYVADALIARQMCISPSTISRFKSVEGFSEWLESEVSYYRTPILKLLEKSALDNINDFKFWQALAEKYGYIKQEEKPGPVVIRLAYNLEDLEEETPTSSSSIN